MRRAMQWVVVLACLVLGLGLHGRNHQQVHFDYYLGTIDLPLSVLLVSALGIGMGLGLLGLLPHLLRQRLRLRRVEAGLRGLSKPGEIQPTNDIPPAGAAPRGP